MPSSEVSEVQFVDGDGKTADARLHTTVYDSGDRIRRALGRLTLLWAIAGVSLFIPLAHFVLVPGFLIAGPVVAMMVYRSEQARERTDGRCPVCEEEISIKMEARDEIPKWTYCPACNVALQITDSQ